MSPTDVAAVTGIKLGNVRKLLTRSVNDSVVVRVGRGRYALAAASS